MTYPQIFIKALAKSFTMLVVSLIVTIIALCLAFYAGASEPTVGADAKGLSALTSFVGRLFGADYFAGILLVSAPVFLWVYCVLSFQSFIKTSVYYVWKGKLSDTVVSKVEASLARVLSDQPGTMVDQVDLKINMLKDLSADNNTPFIQRLVIKFVLNKADLSDVGGADHQHLSSVIRLKIKSALERIAAPSLTMFYALLGLHVLLMILAVAR
jgi:hypothetical protein